MILLKIRLISGSVNSINSRNFIFFESPVSFLPPRSVAYRLACIEPPPKMRMITGTTSCDDTSPYKAALRIDPSRLAVLPVRAPIQSPIDFRLPVPLLQALLTECNDKYYKRFRPECQSISWRATLSGNHSLQGSEMQLKSRWNLLTCWKWCLASSQYL